MQDESHAPALPARDDGDEESLETLQEALGPDFQIRQKLGKGSMAVVYLAKEKALNRLVAVKVLLPGRAKDETARRRFEREAKAAASLTHPNVVQVYRFGRLPDETPYLVMRFVKGRTMEERLAAEGRLPVDLARQVLLNVASALAAAHAQGIVHRDVRPANVLWDAETGSAYLADFGIAALLATSGEDATRLTKTGQMVGDPRYLSPEQLLDQDLTELADMYALGVLGYELFTGEGPYDAKTNTQWITAHLSGQPRDLRQMRPDIDPDVADLLKRCLNREPKHRPSAEQAARVLRGERSAAETRQRSGSVEGPLTVDELLKRRVPQLVGTALATGAGVLGFIWMLTESGNLPQGVFALPFVSCAVGAAIVVAWFHGERGPQHSSVLEWVLLSLVGLAWVAWTAAIVVRA
jgi:serine/threonine protein kinase